MYTNYENELCGYFIIVIPIMKIIITDYYSLVEVMQGTKGRVVELSHDQKKVW